MAESSSARASRLVAVACLCGRVGLGHIGCEVSYWLAWRLRVRAGAQRACRMACEREEVSLAEVAPVARS